MTNTKKSILLDRVEESDNRCYNSLFSYV